MTAVRLEHLSKQFGADVALNDINLDIRGGELFFLLGPSGCGKSTLLRMIAGLLEPSRGRVFFNGVDVTSQRTEKRNAVMCFQSYALWPHMTVAQNIRFGLNVRRMPKAEQDRRVAESLAMVRLEKLADRKPGQLSGGQQQRVALGRALAVNPACLLLDEPLSNLDAKLRVEMRSEIRRICKSQGYTTIYVTHDQKEALSAADRIAVMNSGVIAQVGTPEEIYNRPASAFVANFIGLTNLLRGAVLDGQPPRVHTPAGTLIANSAPKGKEATVSIRPERLRFVDPAANGDNILHGSLLETTFLGESSEHVIDATGQKIKAVAAPPMPHKPGPCALQCDPADVVVLPE